MNEHLIRSSNLTFTFESIVYNAQDAQKVTALQSVLFCFTR